MNSLFGRRSELASPKNQLKVLEHLDSSRFPSFSENLSKFGLKPLSPLKLDTLQINLGKMCNQTCAHCHVDAGPNRIEIMTKSTMEQCLKAIENANLATVDLTGGAPEMNPNFRWFVAEIRKLGVHITDRCNLTIIRSNPKYYDLPLFFKDHQVEVVSSLPHYSAVRTDRQRGRGVFEKSIKALHMLNEVGYGQPHTDLKLNLVYNPTGCFLPGSQAELERDFRLKLRHDFGIEFNHLYCITNMPISRFLNYLITTDNLERYMETLIQAFNPRAAQGVMCRNLISVGWDGKLYDCDFNQMLEMQLEREVDHISKFDVEKLSHRNIKVHSHCYGCTAGSGSSCGGVTA